MEAHSADGRLATLELIGAERRLTALETILRLHVELCEKRASRIEKLLWFVSANSVILLAYLLGRVLHL